MQAIKSQFLLPLARSKIAKTGCWMVDIPRTSSTACRKKLALKFGWPYQKTTLGQPPPTAFSLRSIDGSHIPASRLRERLGPKLWQKIFTFSIIRNPWERYLSLWLYYHFSAHLHSLEQGTSPQAGDEKALFKKYLTRALRNNRPQFSPAHKLLCDEQGNLLVDFVAKYENLQEDLAYVGQRINCPRFGQSEIRNKPPSLLKRHYREYYDTELRDQIAEISRWEIERFDYSFDQ